MLNFLRFFGIVYCSENRLNINITPYGEKFDLPYQDQI